MLICHYADVCVRVSTHDAVAIIEELELLQDNYHWLGVLNRSAGPPVITAAKLCEHFKIPGVPIKSATTLVNKDMLRTFCTGYDIPLANFELFSVSDGHSFRRMELPFVVKPALSLVGKSGVTVVRSNDCLDPAIKNAVANAVNGRVVIEDYLPGPDFSLISFAQDGILHPLCFLEELNQEDEGGQVIAVGFKTCSMSEKGSREQEAQEISKELINIFGINRSALMVSFRADSNGRLMLIEVHLDLGGDLLIEQVFPVALPYDFLELAINLLVGNKVIPYNTSVKPTAILYNRGESAEAVRNQEKFRLITAESDQSLNQKLRERGL